MRQHAFPDACADAHDPSGVAFWAHFADIQPRFGFPVSGVKPTRFVQLEVFSS
jgi:hypothetical protein